MVVRCKDVLCLRFIPRYSLRTLCAAVALCACLLSLYTMLAAPDETTRAVGALKQCGASVAVSDLNETEGVDSAIKRQAWVSLSGVTLSNRLSERICGLDDLVPIRRLECDNVRIRGIPTKENGTAFLDHLRHVEYFSARSSGFTDADIGHLIVVHHSCLLEWQ